MANEKKLDCVILGLLSHDDLTGYDIKKRMDSSLGYFWNASFGSIYPTLNELVRSGFAAAREDSGSARGRLVYSITGAGRQYLREWLCQPAEKDLLRYETLVKLFFGDEAGAAQTTEHITRFRERIEKELEQLLMMEKVLTDAIDTDQTHEYYLITVRFGIKTYNAYLEWCEESAARLRGISEKRNTDESNSGSEETE